MRTEKPQSRGANRSHNHRGTVASVTKLPLQDAALPLPDHVVLPAEPPEWLYAVMSPWDAWAATFSYSLPPLDDEVGRCYRSWKVAYTMMPKSRREWDARVGDDPPLVDGDGPTWDQGLRGLARRLFDMHEWEGRGVASDVHPFRAMERRLCNELGELLAFETPRVWPDEARL